MSSPVQAREEIGKDNLDGNSKGDHAEELAHYIESHRTKMPRKPIRAAKHHIERYNTKYNCNKQRRDTILHVH